VRQLALACILLLSACDKPQVVSRTPPPVSVSPASLPSGIIDPQSLIDQATHLRSTVLRVDHVRAKLTTMSDYMKDSSATSPSISPGQAIWVVAIRGDVRIDALIELPHAQCAVFAYDAVTGDVRSSGAGPAAMCDPYFK